MDAAAANALLAPVRPWLRDHVCTCELKNPVRTEHGVIFSFHKTFDPNEDADENAVTKLREAIDLVYRAFSVHTALALYLREDDADNMGPYTRGISNASVKRQLMQDAPFELKLTIGFCQAKDAAALKRKLVDELVTGLSEVESSDPSYVAAKAHLDALLREKKPRWAEPLDRQPIKATVSIVQDAQHAMTAVEAKDFFAQLAAAMDVLDKYEVPQFGAESHLPMAFELELIQLAQVPITADVATAVTPMISMERARFKLSYVTIDPRLVMCSREELGVFLQAMSATKIELSPIRFNFEPIAPMDHEVDALSFIPMLLSAISDCESVDSLAIGGLFVLFTNPLNRSEICKELINTVLVRAKPLTLEFCVGEAGVTDARILTVHAQHWKAENPNTKLRLKRLALEFYDLNSEFTSALVGVLDEVEELSLANHEQDAPRISPEQVSDILVKFSTLRELSLVHVNLDTMRVFSEMAPPSLESLSLRGLRLDDRQSFLEFLEDLSYPERALSSQLRHLSILDFTQAEAFVVFRLHELEVEYLARALYVNRVLQSVRVLLGSDKLFDRIMQLRTLMKAAESVVPARESVRHSSEEKARRVAFLSVLHNKQGQSLVREELVFDTFLVRQIFAFSDPWAPRSINTS